MTDRRSCDVIAGGKLYWITRIWVKAHRGEMEDDPVVFAMTDRLSLLSILAFIATLVVASLRW